jgi:hypothetical protein
MSKDDLKRAMIAVAITLASTMAQAASPGTAKQQAREAACVVHSGPKGLDVRCPNASVAELLLAFRQAVGLRAEYPDQFAAARVSVVLRRVQLQEALRNAFAEFNFATWEDPKSVPWVKLVGLRRTVEGSQQQAHAYQEPAITYPEGVSSVSHAATTPTTMASVLPQQDLAEMARVREGFANSVITPAVPPVMPAQDRTEMARVREEFARQVGKLNPQALPQVGGAPR